MSRLPMTRVSGFLILLAASMVSLLATATSAHANLVAPEGPGSAPVNLPTSLPPSLPAPAVATVSNGVSIWVLVAVALAVALLAVALTELTHRLVAHRQTVQAL